MSERSGRRVIGTAGHIDHGKTALVEAMTGVDTDRLPEERSRGISIDLGFAELDLGEDAPRVSVVDVPGHEGFVRNMVAGASGIDAVLLVVAADEGVMPQTREHLQVVEALGVERGVVAVTKTDRVESEWVELVVDEVVETIVGTGLAGASVVPVSARTGEGIDRLRAALAEVVSGAPAREDDVPFRLPIDRAFPVAGVGTVVTGTVWSGAVAEGDPVRILPGGESTRVRSIEIHGEAVGEASAGGRAALGLVNAPDHVGRGTVLVSPDRPWSPVGRLDARVTIHGSAPRPVEPGDRVRVLHGTREVMARVRWYDGRRVDPGSASIGRLDLEDDLVAAVGDRFVVRAYSPVETIGGGEVLALDPRRLRGSEKRARAERLSALAEADPASRLIAALEAEEESGIAEPALAMATGLGTRALAAARDAASDRVERHGGRWFAAAARERVQRRLVVAIEEHHERAPLEPGLSLEAARQAVRPADPALAEAAIDTALRSGALERRGTRLARAGHEVRTSGRDREVLDAMRSLYRQAGLEPPDTGTVARRVGAEEARVRDLQRHLAREGELVKLASDWYAHGEALAEAERAVVERIEAGGPADTGELKDLFGLSRKYLIPLLETLDRRGVTRREGNRRVLATRIVGALVLVAALATGCATSPPRGEVPPDGDRTEDPEFAAALEASEREFESQADALAAGIYEPFVHPDSVRPAASERFAPPPTVLEPEAGADPTTEEVLGTLRPGPRYETGDRDSPSDGPAAPFDEGATFTLQVGAYRAETGALVRIRQLADAFPDLPRWYETGSDGRVRVFLGRFETRRSAERVLAELVARGGEGTVLREGP